jgi:hypothetical protein
MYCYEDPTLPYSARDAWHACHAWLYVEEYLPGKTHTVND